MKLLYVIIPLIAAVAAVSDAEPEPQGDSLQRVNSTVTSLADTITTAAEDGSAPVDGEMITGARGFVSQGLVMTGATVGTAPIVPVADSRLEPHVAQRSKPATGLRRCFPGTELTLKLTSVNQVRSLSRVGTLLPNSTYPPPLYRPTGPNTEENSRVDIIFPSVIKTMLRKSVRLVPASDVHFGKRMVHSNATMTSCVALSGE
ncbi:hypothetical protein BZA77DRAFT_347338 [Pyronema omphalodes]|nr:hypothetical protein BZA77DRAFT_347338 [Pyronema omphalodes]